MGGSLRLVAVALLIGVALIVAQQPRLAVGQLAASDATSATIGPLVVSEAGALASVRVRILCYEAGSLGPSNPAFAQLNLTVSDEGRLPVDTLPRDCNYVAVMRERQDIATPMPRDGRPRYTLYNTSWAPSAPSLVAVSDATISLPSIHTFVLFSVLTSLEWEPGPTSPYLTQLGEGLRQASEFLYAMTQGQMAFSATPIETGGRRWDEADIRVLADNRQRPMSYVGGIVPTAMPSHRPGLSYAPGEVYLGRYWDGSAIAAGPTRAEPASGLWSNRAGYSTLAHEWAHYALFLWDEYQQQQPDTGDSRRSTYCTCNDLNHVGPTGSPEVCGGADETHAASVMAYQYTARQLWYGVAGAPYPASCLNTDQLTRNGQSDWETLGRWAEIQGLGSASLLATPSDMPVPLGTTALARDLLTAPWVTARGPHLIYLPDLRRSVHPSNPEPQVTVVVDGAVTAEDLSRLDAAQAYLTLPGRGTVPERVLFLGTTLGPHSGTSLGPLSLLNIEPGARLTVYANAYHTRSASPGRLEGTYTYTSPASGPDPDLVEGGTVKLQPSSWQADLDTRYGLVRSDLISMTVTLTGTLALASPPQVDVCSPDAAVGCDSGIRATMRPAGVGPDGHTWQATLTASGRPMPHRGVLRIRAEGDRTLLRWYQDAGGVPPAHMDGFAPLRDGNLTVDATWTYESLGNYRPPQRAILAPATNHMLLKSPLPVGVGGVVGAPIALTLVGLDSGATSQALPLDVTLFYDQNEVDQLGVSESQLVLLQYDPKAKGWASIGKTGGLDLNWLSARLTPSDETTIFAVGWQEP